jgi:hypothetical protein
VDYTQYSTQLASFMPFLKLSFIFVTVRNVETDLQEAGWEGMDCIYMAQDRDGWRAIVNAMMNIRVP